MAATPEDRTATGGGTKAPGATGAVRARERGSSSSCDGTAPSPPGPLCGEEGWREREPQGRRGSGAVGNVPRAGKASARTTHTLDGHSKRGTGYTTSVSLRLSPAANSQAGEKSRCRNYSGPDWEQSGRAKIYFVITHAALSRFPHADGKNAISRAGKIK